MASAEPKLTKKTMKSFDETEACKKLKKKKETEDCHSEGTSSVSLLFGNQHEGIFTIEIGR